MATPSPRHALVGDDGPRHHAPPGPAAGCGRCRPRADRRAQPGVPEAAGRREIITEATSTAPPALNCAALGILRRDDALMSFRLIVNDAFMEQMRQPQPSTPVAERIMHYIH